jgi:recombination protein RecR
MALPLLPSQLRNLLEDLERLPGVGPKSAQRIAFYLLRKSPDTLKKFADDLQELRGIQRCRVCGMLTEREECQLCRDPQRDHGVLCVVESPLDVLAIERTREYHGRYHVLGGVLSPLDHVGPEDLTIASLAKRVRTEHPREVILALNPSTEGETTTLYLKQLLADTGVTVSRLAQGLPTGAALEFADDLTITRALAGRQTIEKR